MARSHDAGRRGIIRLPMWSLAATDFAGYVVVEERIKRSGIAHPAARPRGADRQLGRSIGGLGRLKVSL
jgi:hypothetical protein